MLNAISIPLRYTNLLDDDFSKVKCTVWVKIWLSVLYVVSVTIILLFHGVVYKCREYEEGMSMRLMSTWLSFPWLVH